MFNVGGMGTTMPRCPLKRGGLGEVMEEKKKGVNGRREVAVGSL